MTQLPGSLLQTAGVFSPNKPFYTRRLFNTDNSRAVLAISVQEMSSILVGRDHRKGQNSLILVALSRVSARIKPRSQGKREYRSVKMESLASLKIRTGQGFGDLSLKPWPDLITERSSFRLLQSRTGGFGAGDLSSVVER